MTTIAQQENKRENARNRPGLLAIIIAFSAITAFLVWQLWPQITAATRPSADIQAGTPREIWAAQDIDSYRFDLQIGCFCPREMTRAVTVKVVDGQVSSVTYVDDGTAADPQIFARFATVDQLFERLAEMEAEDPVKFEVTYDEQLGIPLSADIDVSEMMADEELWLTVANFEALP